MYQYKTLSHGVNLTRASLSSPLNAWHDARPSPCLPPHHLLCQGLGDDLSVEWAVVSGCIFFVGASAARWRHPLRRLILPLPKSGQNGEIRLVLCRSSSLRCSRRSFIHQTRRQNASSDRNKQARQLMEILHRVTMGS